MVVCAVTTDANINGRIVSTTDKAEISAAGCRWWRAAPVLVLITWVISCAASGPRVLPLRSGGKLLEMNEWVTS